MDHTLQTLLSRPDVWRAGERAGSRGDTLVLPTGHPALDAALHHGGWPRAALTELLADACGIGEMQLLAPALASCAQGGGRVFLVAPPHRPYAPALQALGLQPERVLVLRPARATDMLWSLEQILRSGASACLLGWLPQETRATAGASCLRRLQVAAQASAGPAFLFRPVACAREPSPAALRLRLAPSPQRLGLEILKQRGGAAGQRLAIERTPSLQAPQVDPALLPALVRGAPAPASAGGRKAWVLRAAPPAPPAALH